MDKLKSKDTTELDRYYHPIPQICAKLPDPKSVRDFSECWVPVANGKHDSYKMVQGSWKKTGSNL